MPLDLRKALAASVMLPDITSSKNDVSLLPSIVSWFVTVPDQKQATVNMFVIASLSMQDIWHICVRRGGVDIGQSHKQWLSTVAQSPNVISMSFAPITSLLSGVEGNGFLTHAVNLYLRCE